MTRTRTCRCGQPATEGRMCLACVEELDQVIVDLGVLIPELQTVLTRRDQLNRATRKPVDQAGEVEDWDPRITLVANPSPVSFDASDQIDHARAVLARWHDTIEHLEGAETWPEPDPIPEGPLCGWRLGCYHESCGLIRKRRTLRNGWARWHGQQNGLAWLRRNVLALAATPDGPRALIQLRRLRDRLERFVFGGEPDIHAGLCDEPDIAWWDPDSDVVRIDPPETAPTCGAQLWARFGDAHVICDVCGARYDIADRKQYMEEVARDRLLLQSQIVVALRSWGEDISFDRLEKWIRRDREVFDRDGLAGPWRHPPVLARAWEYGGQRTDTPVLDKEGRPLGRALFRVGDVIDRVNSMAAAKKARQERSTA